MKSLKDIFKKKENINKKSASYWPKDVRRGFKVPDMTMYEYLVSRSKDNLNLNCIGYFDKNITYKTFFKKVEECAKSFKKLGVVEGDVITICMPNTPEAIIAFYACNKIGAIANMVHPLSGQEEIKLYVNETNSKILMMIDVCYEKVKEIINETSLYKTIVVSAKDSMPLLFKVGYQFTRGFKVLKPKRRDRNYIYWNDFIINGLTYNEEITHNMKKDDPAVILHSGGTTGVPKGIVLSNANFNALEQQCEVNIDKAETGDKIITILPIFHGFGLGVCIHTGMCKGIKNILMPEFDNKRFTKILKSEKPQLLACVPTLWNGMVTNKALENTDLSFLKYCINGGDTMYSDAETRFNDFLHKHGANIKLSTGYGMTESTAATCYSYGESNVLGSIGVPMVGNLYKICIPNTDCEVEVGEEGEICVNGPTVMLGYLNNEKETNLVLRRHKDKKIWLHTGDLGYIAPNGIVYFTQRLKRMIVSNGYNIYPSQIEEVIESHDKVLQCSVVGVPHKYKGEVAKAYIVLKEGVSASMHLKKEIKELCKDSLAKYSLPKEYEFRKSLPQTLLGKVNYKKLSDENK
ncbi:MAG: acyl--CoA ligase [Bacilli bacterium]|nr:acyl--CoA ligase [Bacilli bacterium]